MKRQAGVIFKVSKPEHFTNHRHCCECAEHHETLLAHNVDSISISELGKPGWDPLCFSSAEGILYYMPAMIRLTLDTINTMEEMYLEQLLFHLTYKADENRVLKACGEEQRKFIARFFDYLNENYNSQIQNCGCSDVLLKAREIWDGRI